MAPDGEAPPPDETPGSRGFAFGGIRNNRDPILVTEGSTTPNNTVNGYNTRDTNLDGVVKYAGPSNDRDPILVNVRSTTPNNVWVQQLP